MKKAILAVMISILGIMGFAGCGNSESKGQYKDGSYTASAKGNNDEIKLEVKIEKGEISAIEILEQNETPGIFDPVKDTMIPQIVEKQTTEGIDTITGATVSSKAVIEAVNTALEQAK